MELLDLVEMEVRELLDQYDFPGDDTPIIRGSALGALEDPSGKWGDKIVELFEKIDEYIPEPERDNDKPFIMPIEELKTRLSRVISYVLTSATTLTSASKCSSGRR